MAAVGPPRAHNEIRVVHEASFMSVADRSILSCWGVRGVSPGRRFRITIDPDGPAERVMLGLCDWEPVVAGQVICIETTGDGTWGDPRARRPWRVAVDVRQGKVSLDAATADYGVVFADGDAAVVDEAATAERRARLRAAVRCRVLKRQATDGCLDDVGYAYMRAVVDELRARREGIPA